MNINKYTKCFSALFTLLILLSSQIMLSTAIAKDNVEPAVTSSAGITIIGDQELPQVLYIVPWKEAQRPTVKPPQATSPFDSLQIPCQRTKSEKENNPGKTPTWPCLTQ